MKKPFLIWLLWRGLREAAFCTALSFVAVLTSPLLLLWLCIGEPVLNWFLRKRSEYNLYMKDNNAD